MYVRFFLISFSRNLHSQRAMVIILDKKTQSTQLVSCNYTYYLLISAFLLQWLLIYHWIEDPRRYRRMRNESSHLAPYIVIFPKYEIDHPKHTITISHRSLQTWKSAILPIRMHAIILYSKTCENQRLAELWFILWPKASKSDSPIQEALKWGGWCCDERKLTPPCGTVLFQAFDFQMQCKQRPLMLWLTQVIFTCRKAQLANEAKDRTSWSSWLYIQASVHFSLLWFSYNVFDTALQCCKIKAKKV